MPIKQIGAFYPQLPSPCCTGVPSAVLTVWVKLAWKLFTLFKRPCRSLLGDARTEADIMPLTTQHATNSFFIGMITLSKNKLGLTAAIPRSGVTIPVDYTQGRGAPREKNVALCRTVHQS